MEKHTITINTYHEYMETAFSALRHGLLDLDESRSQEEEDHVSSWLMTSAGMQCRFAFLLAANALEAAANAMLLDLNLSHASYTDLEKLPTLLKIETFCLARGVTLERGDIRYARIKDVVKCRNEFVHPKPTRAPTELTDDESGIEIVVSATKTRKFPTAYGLFEPDHSIIAFRDILSFLSWVVFDVCNIQQQEGALILGYQSCGSTGDILLLGEEHDFDLRTFNYDTKDGLTSTWTLR